MKIFIILTFIFLFSCKKEKSPDIVIPELTERIKILTQHSWSMTHQYIDSTSYAKSHLSEWPLSSTEDFMDPRDTCEWDSKNLFLLDGSWKFKKSIKCPASLSEDVGRWKLINNENDFVIIGQDTMHIVELNNSSFKMYYESYVYQQQQLVRVEYIMWTYKSN